MNENQIADDYRGKVEGMQRAARAVVGKSRSERTISEMGESMTGYEEIGVKAHFGATLAQLLEHDATMGIRALIFTDIHRLGSTNVQQSKDQAMSLRLDDVMSYFTAEPEEQDDLEDDLGDDPTSALGKADSDAETLD